MPEGENGHVCGESAGLQNEGDFDEDFAGLVLGGADGGVGGFGGAVGDQDFDEEVDAHEGRQDPAWVKGREPGDVVEGAGEDEVCCAGVDGPFVMEIRMGYCPTLRCMYEDLRAREKEHDACDQDAEIVDIEGA